MHMQYSLSTFGNNHIFIIMDQMKNSISQHAALFLPHDILISNWL